MRIRLLTTIKYRIPGSGSAYLSPGIYNTEDPDFPEALRGESRLGVVEILDGPGEPARLEDTESTDPDDESNDDIGESEEEEVEEEEVEENKEVAVEEKPKKKDKIKRRG